MHRFSASKSGTTLELLVYGDIGGPFEGITAQEISDAMKSAGKFDSMCVRINSRGGDPFEGTAIYNLLRAQKKPIDVCVDGLAASAASLVAMVGDKMSMGTGAKLMIHNAHGTQFESDANQMREFADVLDSVSAAMAEIYVAKSGMDPDEVRQMMDAETWMSAQDAIDKGFCDACASDEERMKQAAALAASFDLSHFKRVPESFRQACQRFAAEAKTKRVDGEDLAKGAFAYRPSDKLEDWKLPIKFSSEDKTKRHIRNAIARFNQTDMPDAAEKTKAWDRIVAAAKEHGIEVSEESDKNGALVQQLEARNAALTEELQRAQASARSRTAELADANKKIEALAATARENDARAQAAEERTERALAETVRQVGEARADIHRHLRLAGDTVKAREAEIVAANKRIEALNAEARDNETQTQAVQERTERALDEAVRQVESVRGDVHRRLRVRAVANA